MIGFLRRRSPANPALAVLYWLALAVTTVTAVFIAFWYLDRYLPGAGMF